MEDYSKHIAIIGAGISGLALASTLKRADIPVVIFEKSSNVSEHGAGISLSRNGRTVLKHLGLDQKVAEKSGKPEKASFFSNGKEVTSILVDVITTSRQTIYKALLDDYTSLDGEIIFNYELSNIDLEESTISFTNNLSYKVLHIVACDGIKSYCRKKCFPSSGEPNYSGYSVWRGIIDKKQKNIETHLGPNFHIVTYPINNTRTSFVAAIKTNTQYKESWKVKGSYRDLKSDLPVDMESVFSFLKEDDDFYKWGVYTRPKVNKLFAKNITFLGDAAHPIVPFIGQGGCLALEDAYVFGMLVSKFKNDFNKIQIAYQKIRLKRIHQIQMLSERQGLLNHLKNPVLILCRNLIMKYSPVISKRVKLVWNYDPMNEINSIK